MRRSGALQSGNESAALQPQLRPPPVPSVSRIPPEALAAVERVLAHRAATVAETPGSERWRTTTVEHQAKKAESHAMEALCGVVADVDTGAHPLIHAAARALLGAQLFLDQQREKP